MELPTVGKSEQYVGVKAQLVDVLRRFYRDDEYRLSGIWPGYWNEKVRGGRAGPLFSWAICRNIVMMAVRDRLQRNPFAPRFDQINCSPEPRLWVIVDHYTVEGFNVKNEKYLAFTHKL